MIKKKNVGKQKAYTIRFEQEVADALHRKAKEHGFMIASYIRAILIERLKKEKEL